MQIFCHLISIQPLVNRVHWLFVPKVSRHAVLISPARVVQAVAALLSEDTSAIVTLKSSGLDSPKELEGKRYASYGARYSSDTCEVALDALSLNSMQIWDITCPYCSSGLGSWWYSP